MDYLTYFLPIILMLVVLYFRIWGYTETDKSGRKYHRNLFYPGRICPGCGLRIVTKIPTCPSCDRDFSKDNEGSNVQHKDTF
jgi:hypothetical protein